MHVNRTADSKMLSSDIRGKLAVGISDIPTYLFYRVYCWQLKMWGAKETPEYTALIAVSMMLTCNAMPVFGAGLIVVGYPSAQAIWVPAVIAIYSIFLIVGYFIFVRGGAYLRIRDKYSRLTEIEHRKGRLLLLAYVVGSILLFMFTIPA